ncbi:MAG: ribonuclease HI family protein [Candidatus Hodarchaeota archaeon]
MNDLIKTMETLKIYTDGAARGNPGPGASAFLFVHNNKIIHQGVNFIGTVTNNQAEYQAIINALKAVRQFQTRHIQIYSDSNLVIQQINRKWKINVPHLQKLNNQVSQLKQNFEKVEFLYVRRNNPYIQKCDALCNEKLDSEGIRI